MARHLWSVAIFLALLHTVRAFGGLCNRDASMYGAGKTPGDNGFSVSLEGQPTTYVPGKTYTVSVKGHDANQKFKEFMLVAVRKDWNDKSNVPIQSLGTFQLLEDGKSRFSAGCPSAVTHTTSAHKPRVSVLWSAPPSGSGCVQFRVAVVQEKTMWFKDDGKLTYEICEAPQDVIAPPTRECCACGEAKYKLTFKGLWSRHTHPQDFPSNTWLTHWSDLIGASHSPNYVIWEFGGLASDGVKGVAEWGSTHALEAELKQNSEKVRTILKTKGLWPPNVQSETVASFSLNRRFPLISFVSMLGPSPDWFTGLSGINLCMTNCTWNPRMVIDLYPVDAGTDSGITYMSPNTPTMPREKIHGITSEYPKNPKSPFFRPDKTPLPPVAQVVLERQLVRGSQCPDADVPEDEEERPISTTSGTPSCMLSPWNPWSPCSTACGNGIRMRQRMLKGPQQPSCANAQLVEKEMCMGAAGECPEEAIDTTDPCALTSWSEWSPCSVTCGHGESARTRMFLDKRRSQQCTVTTMEKKVCSASRICNVQLDMGEKKRICMQPLEIGPCRGHFERFYFSTTSRRCLNFTYGGCRGNENNFMSFDECDRTCDVLMGRAPAAPESLRASCMLSEWSEWSTCSTTCGAGIQEQRRMIKGGDEPCPQKLVRRRRCRERKCPVDCLLGHWGAWSACPHTCGERSIQERTRPVIRRARRGGKVCGPQLEQRYCELPSCPPIL